MAQWLGILHRDLRPRKPSSKPLVQKAIARNLVRDYGVSPKQAQKFSRSERKFARKRFALRLPYDRKVGHGIGSISTIEKLRRKLRQRLIQRFRRVPRVTRVPKLPRVPKRVTQKFGYEKKFRLAQRRTHLRVTRITRVPRVIRVTRRVR